MITNNQIQPCDGLAGVLIATNAGRQLIRR
jgi:hypothetical protein